MKKVIISIFILVFIFNIAEGQTRFEQRMEIGDTYFNQRQYHEAIDVYNRILRREDSQDARQILSFKIGESYRLLLNYQEAKSWYITALNLGYDDPVIYLHLSEMSLGLEEFDDSMEYAKSYLEYMPDNERGLKILESAKYSKDHYGRETMFEVYLVETLSSSGEEWGIAFFENYPIFYDDPAKYDMQFDIEIDLNYNNVFYWARRYETPKDKIVFSSTRVRDERGVVLDQEGYSNIYQVLYSRQDRDWGVPELIRGGINSDFHDGFLSYDENSQIGYFMNCGGFAGERETCDIYTSEYDPQRDIWGEAKLFHYNSDNYNIGYPSINDRGNVLYFASDRTDGYGGYDIYKVDRDNDGFWGEPQNLGDIVNTPYNDAYPSIAGNVLYLSSFGHPGMGGFDVFYSEIDEEGNYGIPQNMGAPINSSADDFGFVINDEYSEGFFSSNRSGGSGNDDLYYFSIITNTITLEGLVSDKFTGEPMRNFEFFIIGDDNSFYSIVTNNNGRYELSDLSTDVNFDIEAFHDDYEHLSEKLLVRDQLLSSQFESVATFTLNLELVPLRPMIVEEDEPVIEPIEPEYIEMAEIERIVIEEEPVEEEIIVYEEKIPVMPVLPFDDYGMPTIYFDFAKHDIRPFSRLQLDSVVDYLRANPDKGVVISAHTDEIAGHLYNFYLSQERAFSTMNYLIKNGIDENRLYPSGYGKMDLIIKNAQTEEEHQINRRANFEPILIIELQTFIKEASKHSFRYLNSIEKDVHFSEGVEFMVQFVATKNPVHPRFYANIIERYPRIDIIYYFDEDRFHRYLVGSFRNFNSAYNMMRNLREMDYDTYIVAFNNGERISVSLAQSLIEGH